MDEMLAELPQFVRMKFKYEIRRFRPSQGGSRVFLSSFGKSPTTIFGE